MTIRVLIIDDSPTMRAILMARLSQQPDIIVVATASNAAEGRELIKQFNPDVVTLDIEMPGMNGLDFLEKIMTLRPTPVIIVSGATQLGTETTARALMLGAVDCYSKTDRHGGMRLDDKGVLARLVREAAQVRFHPRTAQHARIQALPNTPDVNKAALIAIGSSTGGVEALQTLLRGFPADCPPTMIVQHVNPRFAPAIARTLDQETAASVCIAEPNMQLTPGTVYLAPGDDRHLTVAGSGINGAGFRVRLQTGAPDTGHVPSVNVLFESVAQKVRHRAVGILLTGMGADGARGLLALSRAGAITIAQDEASSAVFGMPRAAIALGAAGTVLPIDRIADHVLRTAA